VTYYTTDRKYNVKVACVSVHSSPRIWLLSSSVAHYTADNIIIIYSKDIIMCTTYQQFAGSIPDGVIGSFH